MLKKAYAAIARSLVDFGYPGITAAMIEECHKGWLDGKTGMEIPHGIIGMFASKEFEQHPSLFGKPKVSESK